MNRQQRRRLKIKEKDPIYHMKYSDFQRVEKEIADRTAENTFIMMLALPVMVIHDKYSLLMKKELDGMSREERMVNLIMDQYDAFADGFITIDDCLQVLKDECGIDLFKQAKGRRQKV